MRANAGFLSVSRDEEVDDINYDGDLSEPGIGNLRGTGLLANTSQFQADIDREEREIQDELSDYDMWPILQVEFLYRF